MAVPTNLKSSILALTVALTLAACGGGGGGGTAAETSGTNGSNGTNDTTASARVATRVTPSLGQFAEGAHVRIRLLDGTEIGNGIVDATGTATVQSAVGLAGPFLIEAGVAGDRYFDEKTKTVRTIDLPAGAYALRAATPYLGNAIGVTPFTELAVGLLEARSGGLTGATVLDIRAANLAIEKQFQLDQTFVRYANEPTSAGILSAPDVFDSLATTFVADPYPIATGCTTLSTGQIVCELPWSFDGGLYPIWAHAVANSVFSYMTATGSDVVQLIHGLRDDLADGSFDLRVGSRLVDAVDPAFVSSIDAWMVANGTSTGQYLDVDNQVRQSSDGSLVTSATQQRNFRSRYLGGLMGRLTELELQMLREYKGNGYNYSGYNDFGLGQRAIDVPLLQQLVRSLLETSAAFADRVPTNILDQQIDNLAEQYGTAGLQASTLSETIATAQSSLATRFNNYIYGPDSSCGAGMKRSLTGICVEDTSSATTSDAGCGTPNTIRTMQTHMDPPASCRSKQFVFAYASTKEDACFMTGDAFGQDRYRMAYGRTQSSCWCIQGQTHDAAVQPWTCYVFY